MYFLIEDFKIKVSANIKGEFESKPVYNKSFLKTKMKSHDDEVTEFPNKWIPTLDTNLTCLEVISLDSTLRKDDNFYLQVFLKERKYIAKKVVRNISHNLGDFSFSDESGEE